jgi:hypothetical protein
MRTLSLVAVFALVFVAGGSQATAYVYTLTGVTFADNGWATGTYSTNGFAFTGWDITVWAYPQSALAPMPFQFSSSITGGGGISFLVTAFQFSAYTEYPSAPRADLSLAVSPLDLSGNQSLTILAGSPYVLCIC